MWSLSKGLTARRQNSRTDEIDIIMNQSLVGGHAPASGQTFRHDESEVATSPQFRSPAEYAMTVGGSSVHFTANFWRFRESDFMERSLWGSIEGTNFVDWPISYAELEPYYTKVDWEIGVSGAPGPTTLFARAISDEADAHQLVGRVDGERRAGAGIDDPS